MNMDTGGKGRIDLQDFLSFTSDSHTDGFMESFNYQSGSGACRGDARTCTTPDSEITTGFRELAWIACVARKGSHFGSRGGNQRHVILCNCMTLVVFKEFWHKSIWVGINGRQVHLSHEDRPGASNQRSAGGDRQEETRGRSHLHHQRDLESRRQPHKRPR